MEVSSSQYEELIAIAARIEAKIERLSIAIDDTQADIDILERRLSELENNVIGYDP